MVSIANIIVCLLLIPVLLIAVPLLILVIRLAFLYLQWVYSIIKMAGSRNSSLPLGCCEAEDKDSRG